MSDAANVSTWIGFAAGCLSLAAGVFALLGGRVLMLPWQHRRMGPRQGAWVQALIGVFALAETIPRLADASDVVVLICSFVAVIPLLFAVPMLLDRRAQA